MDTTLKQVVAGVIIAGAGFIGGSAGSIEATEVTNIDATKARSVGEVVIEKVITAPTTTVDKFTLNDLVSEIEKIDREIAPLVKRRNDLVAKIQAVQTEVQTKFDEEQAKVEEKLEVIE